MVNTIKDYNENELNEVIYEIINEMNYFNEIELNEKLIVNIIYKTIEIENITKSYINVIIKLTLKLFYEILMQNMMIRLPNLGLFSVLEIQGIRMIQFKPHKDIIKMINMDIKYYNYFSIFKVIKSFNGYKLKINEYHNPFKIIMYNQLKKHKINLKDKLDLKKIDFEKNNEKVITLVLITKLISNKITFNKSINFLIPKIIQQFIRLLIEAIILGIRININIGIFSPLIITDQRIRLRKMKCKTYNEGNYTFKDISGKMSVEFIPSIKLIKALKKLKMKLSENLCK